MKNFKLLFASCVVVAAIFACKKTDSTPATEFYGDAVTLGGGTAKTYYRTDATGNPTEIGIAISDAAMSALPKSSTENSMPLPAEAQAKTPFKFVLLDWNHAGHEPAKVYDVPHFDVHFYITTDADRLKINPSDATTALPPADGYLPQPTLSTGVVPQMGNHWVDLTSPELNGGKFTNTFIYGSAYGKVIFYEPMITPEFMKSSPHSHNVIKQPQKYPTTGYFPSEYCVKYNADAKQYEISIETFFVK
jgi:Domain of unknown function (DUF5602)